MSISFFLLWPALSMAVSDHWGSIGSVLLKVLIIAALVALNGFFVACEFAIVKVRSSQLDTLVEEGNQRAGLTKYIRAHLDAYLSATACRRPAVQSPAVDHPVVLLDARMERARGDVHEFVRTW